MSGEPRTTPLSFAQQRLWFLDQLEPGSAEYVVPFAWRLAGDVDVCALESALNGVIARHDVLRATFVATDGEPRQRVRPAESTRLPVLDAVEGDLGELVAAFAGGAFDLGAGPLWRAGLFRVTAREHVFVFAAHHIVMDAWSAQNFADELSEGYRAALGRTAPKSPSLPMQYSDFAAWQRDSLSGPAAGGHLAYWREQLAGLEQLDLPTDRPRRSAAGTEGSAVGFTVAPAVADGLRALARDQRATLFMVALACVQVVLGRYAGRDDVAVGTPMSSRGLEEAEPLIGLFVNTVVVRTDLGGDPRFAELLDRVREATLDAYEHQDLPYDQLVKELRPDRAQGSLFQAMLVLNTAFDQLALDGLRVGSFPIEFPHAKFDLTVTFTDGPDGLSGALRYRTALFDQARMTRMGTHLERLLTAVVADPAARLSELPMLTDGEYQALVGGAEERAAEPGPALHELVAAHAAKSPAAIALVDADGAVTYGELNASANRLAGYLRGLGAGEGKPIAICLPRSAGAVVCLLAALKTGAGYVALDPAHPEERLAYLLADTGAEFVLAGAGDRANLPAGFGGILIDPAEADLSVFSAADPLVPVHPDSAAYVVYTSGSTGQPKGVVATHAGVTARLRHLRADYELGADDVAIAMTGLGFDASVREIFGALGSGARLVIAGPDAATDPAALVSLLARHEVSVVLSVVPTVLYELAAQPVTAGLPAVRLVLCSGEKLRPERLTGCAWLDGRVVNQFGPTETTMTATRARLPARAERTWTYDVGCPAGNTKAYILDEALNPCPEGVPGELYLGGVGVARCYQSRPALTAERFVPNPFGPGRLYRTGDRCRWSAAHTIEHLGRADHQLKLRGTRIEPGEIETALRGIAGVTETVVVIREDIPGDQRLTAYFTSAGEVPPSTDVLRAGLGRVLPAYLVPSVFVPLPSLPLTPNGKVDRRALPVPGAARPELGLGLVRARTPVEQAIAGVWADVLGLDEIGVFDNFFALGGHSLLATRVVARLAAAVGEVPVRLLFERPTVAGLAELLTEHRRGHAPAPIVRVDRDGPLPLSFAQQRLWFLDQLDPGSVEYTIPLAWRLTGSIDVAAMRAALTEVANRHDALRTTFTTVDATPTQLVAPPGAAPFAEVLVTEDEVDQTVTAFLREPFDLRTGPVWRALLVRTGDTAAVLAIALHHIVADAWSAAVLVGEVGSCYQAELERREPELRDLPVQYVDVAHWERERLYGPVLDGHLGYWRDRLAGVTPLELPVDRPRTANRSTEGAALDFTLPAEIADGLRELARANGVTVFMVLLAGLQSVLARYTGQTDITVGTPVSNRTRTELEPLIGLFVNTLVLRTDLAGDPAFTDVLARVRATTLSAYEHQDLPFERLVEELQPARDLGRTPLFQTSLSVNNTPPLTWRLAGVEVADHPLWTHGAKFDLALAFTDTGEELTGAVTYSAALFDESRIERLCEHLLALFAAIVADPGLKLSEVPLLGTAEYDTVVRDWGAGPDTGFTPAWPVEVLARQAESRPDALAVRHGRGGSLDYRELAGRVERMAAYLAAKGAGPEVVVGICLPRSADVVVAILAVLRTGAAYLPLEPSHPVERQAFMLEDAGADLLVIGGGQGIELGGRCPDVEVVDLGDLAIRAEIEAGGVDCPAPATSEESLVYVIYTSGSTGRPKGVQITRRGLENYLGWAVTNYPFHRDGGALLHSSLAFDMTVTTVLLPVLAGHPVDLADETVDPAELLEAAEEAAGSLLKLTPTHLKMLASSEASFPPGVIVGGEDLTVDVANRVLEALPPDGYLVNEYGPTETVVGCCVHTLTEPVPGGQGSVPIGKPIGGTQVYVLDAAMSPCPIGVPGELYIGGAGVARGYRGRPALTAERFVPNPFGSGRLYRTGDACRWSAAGYLDYLGRTDLQVKIRGYRVELGEIEARLSELSEVAEAVVDAREDVPGDRRLVAYLVPTGDEPSVPALRAKLGESMPDYLVPSAFVMLQRFPLTGSGKVDRRALPAPDMSRPELESGFVRPRTLVEELVAGVWSDVLGLDEVGVFDDFFALGGHSLLATQVVARLGQLCGQAIGLRTLFEALTVAAMASRLAGPQPSSVLAPIPRVDRGGDLPLSFAQQRLWFLDQLEPGGTEYVVPMAWRLTGEVDVVALKNALAKVVARHEVLRTGFRTVAGKPSQWVTGGVEVSLPVLETGDQAISEAVAEFTGRPFPLDRAPLWRAAVVRAGTGDCVFVLAMHHIIADAWSSGVLVRELSHYYTPAAPALPSLPVQYGDFAAWQRNSLTGPVLEEHLAHWRERLDGIAPLELPADRPRAPIRSTEGAAVNFTIPPSVVAGLRTLARERRVTMFMIVLAGVQAVLARYAGQTDVAVGTPIAGRNRAETEGLIGFFINTLVLRTDLSGEPSFAELLDRVRAVTLDAYEHQDLPFERLVEELRPERDLARTPLFQVMLSVDNTPPGEWALPGVDVTEFPLTAVQAKFDLTLAFADTPAGLLGTIRYSTALFDEDRMTRLCGHLRRLLRAGAAEPDTRLSELPLLTAAEQDRLVHVWNTADVPSTGSRLLHELVELRAVSGPDSPAVTDTDGGELTYGELNRRANQLARHLRARGAGPERLVGVCLQRSVTTVVSLLAVLKTGAAYLPLDPAYPAERLAFILGDAGAGLVVTDGTASPPGWDGEMVDLTDPGVRADLERQLPSDARVPMSSGNLAYVIYTSGSTGKPKGVQVTHDNAVRLFEVNQAAFGIDEGQVWLSTHSYAFDFSVWEIWGALTAGGRAVIASHAVMRDPERLAEVVTEQRVTMLSQTPTAFRTLMPRLIERGPGELRSVVFGGEALDLTALRPWYEDRQTRAVALVNMYGITETTVHTTRLELTGSTRGDAASSPIGRPLEDLRVYVLNAAMTPQPVGVPGELYVGGAGVARGYLGRPALTAERFVPDPFRGGRLYRTGDVGRWTADGTLEYLGRTDHQVKIRGFRIELGEIEARLLESEYVSEAVVLAREDTPGDRRLVGYVVAAGERPSVSDLRAWLEVTLPGYMVPAHFVLVDALPLTSSGKVNRGALPAPDTTRPELNSGLVAPRSQPEKLIAAIWAQVLGIDEVGVFDNFFDLGGDSILSIQIVARAATEGIRLTPRMVFEHQTVAALAAAASVAPVVKADQGTVTGEAPLTPIQRWFFARELPERGHYNQSVLLTVPAELTQEELTTVLRELVEHHDALRMRFLAEEGRRFQHNPAERTGGALLTVLECEPAAFPEAARALQAGLDIEAGTVFRALLAGFGGERRLLLAAHHLVVDGVSWRILLEDLETGYRQLRAGGPIRLPAKTTSFLDWARSLPDYARSAMPADERAYWTSGDGRVPLVHADNSGGENSIASAAEIACDLGPELTRSLLVDVPAAYRTRINDVLLTALARSLSTSGLLAEPGSTAVDVEGHGREDILPGIDLSRTVGWFTSIYPVVLRTEPGAGIAEVLKDTKQVLRELPSNGIGHGILATLAGETGLVDSNGQILFNYLGQFDNVLSAERDFAGAEGDRGPSQASSGLRSHVLEINSEISGGVLRVRFGYSRNLHREETVAELAAGFLAELEAVIEHCVTPGNIGAVPADFPLAGLDQHALDSLLAQYQDNA